MSFNIKPQGEQISPVSSTKASTTTRSSNEDDFSKLLNENKISPNQAQQLIEQTSPLNRRSLHFSVNDNSGDIVIQIIDKDTDEVVRIIPHGEMNQFLQSFQSNTGSLINTKV